MMKAVLVTVALILCHSWGWASLNPSNSAHVTWQPLDVRFFSSPLASKPKTPPVVKVLSYLCDLESVREAEADKRTRKGSGVLIHHNGSLFVITSSHVVYHGSPKEGICHAIRTTGGTESSATLKAANYANGLALLAVEDSNKRSDIHLGQDAFSLTELILSKQRVNDESRLRDVTSRFVDMIGFRHENMTRIVRKDAFIISLDDEESYLFPLAQRLLNVEGHNEYGMSGGGLFQEDESAMGALRLIGIISHRVFEISRRGVPKPANASPGQVSGTTVALIVPVETVADWVINVLLGNGARSQFWEDFKEQLNRRVSASIGELVFTEVNCEPDEVGGDGVGIGGDDRDTPPDLLDKVEALTRPVGGDGVGIGGRLAGNEPGNVNGCHLKISHKPGAQSGWPFGAKSRKSFYEPLLASVTPGSPSYIVRERYLTELRLGKKSVKVIGLAPTLARIVLGNFEPVLVEKSALQAVPAPKDFD